MNVKKIQPIQDYNALQYLHSLFVMLELTDEEKRRLNTLCPGQEKIEGLGTYKPMPFRKLTDEARAFILANYKDMTLAELAFELDLGSTTIRAFLISKGITDYKRYTNPKALTDKDRAFILRHYEKHTMREMAAHLNKPYAYISNFLRGRGLRGKRERA